MLEAYKHRKSLATDAMISGVFSAWLAFTTLWPRRQDVAPSAYRRCTNYCCPAFWECRRDDGRWHAAPLPLFSAHQTHPFCGKRLPTDVPGMNLSRTLLSLFAQCCCRRIMVFCGSADDLRT